eukprot:SAG31_NODE_39630_length_286_cov_5.652406_1_plen_41_part_10
MVLVIVPWHEDARIDERSKWMDAVVPIECHTDVLLSEQVNI